MVELTLHAVNGPFTGEELVVPAPEYVVSRDRLSPLTILHDSEMSRPHAKLTYDQGHWSIADLGSRNGTVVNGTRIGTKPVAIWHGTIIGIGSSLLRVGGVIPLPPDSSAGREGFIHSTPPPVIAGLSHPQGFALQDALQTYQHGVDMLTADGSLMPAEAGELVRVQDRLGLTDGDTYEIRARAYVRLIYQAMQATSPDLPRLVRDLRSLLGFQTSGHPAVTSAAAQAAAFFANSSLRNGLMPVVSSPCMAMMPGEACHLEVEGTWLDANTEGLVSYGILVATNQRVAFVGSVATFGVGWTNVLALDFESEGLLLHSNYNPEPLRVMYADAMVSEVVQKVCEPYSP